MKNKNINLKKFLSVPHKIITSKEALKDVIPVKWDDIKKKRTNNQNQVVNFIETK